MQPQVCGLVHRGADFHVADIPSPKRKKKDRVQGREKVAPNKCPGAGEWLSNLWYTQGIAVKMYHLHVIIVDKSQNQNVEQIKKLTEKYKQ